MHLSALERKILNLIQKDIPLTHEPFKILSKKLGMKEDEFLESLKRLRKRGIIRSLAARLDHRKLGFKSSLIALKVPLDKLESIAKKIIDYPEVTHCYQRKNEYNLWVVFLSLKKERLSQFLKKLTKQIGRENILNLPTKRQFKLKTRLKI